MGQQQLNTQIQYIQTSQGQENKMQEAASIVLIWTLPPPPTKPELHTECALRFSNTKETHLLYKHDICLSFMSATVLKVGFFRDCGYVKD